MSASAFAASSQTRELPLRSAPHSALLVIDMQNAFCRTSVAAATAPPLACVIENIASLIAAARAAHVEVVHTVVEALTPHARERSLDYKVTGFLVERGSWGAQVVHELRPAEGEIVLRKGSSSVFVSTNLTYLLRNMGVEQVVVAGGLTDQCIDSAVRDACDLGFLVTCVTDAVYTHSEERHRSALANNRGYCRQLNTARVVGELNDLKAAARSMSTSTTAPLQGQGSAPGNSEKSEQFPSPRLELQAQPEEARPVGPVVSAPREYVRFEIVDLNGKALSKVVPARHKDSRVYLYSGALALGANSEVLTVPEEVANLGCPNGLLIPFWETCRALPWAADAPGAPPGGVAVKRVFCEQSFMAKGQLLPNLAVPRTVCRRLLGELAQRGLRVLSATELEFCMVTAGEPAGYTRKGEEQGWKPLFGEGSCGEIFVTLSGTKTAGFQYAIEEAMEAIGVDVRTMNCEYGPAQLEITFGPALGIASPDAAVSFRTAVKEIAQQRGLCATFYSKPFGERGVGSGGHLNFSLWRAEASAEEPSSPWQGEAPHGFVPCTAGESPNALSPEAEAFLAGIIEHAPALEALCAPTPGCYGRHGNWAPTVANWGFDDRTAAIRVHADAHRGANECYAELRMPSSAANPYLVLAGMVAAGLDGVDRKCQLPPPGQTQADGASVLPKSLPEALDELIRDTQLCTRLGAALVEWFVGVKRAEIARVQEWTVEAMESPDGSRRAADTASMLALQRMYLEFV